MIQMPDPHGPTIYAPVTFCGPSECLSVVFASVNREWYRAVTNAVIPRPYINVIRLVHTAGLMRYICDCIYRFASSSQWPRTGPIYVGEVFNDGDCTIRVVKSSNR